LRLVLVEEVELVCLEKAGSLNRGVWFFRVRFIVIIG
jgi:hypothetical protein